MTIRGLQINQPAYASNRFGATLLGAPYIPHLIEHDTRDFIFLTLSGQRSSTPFNEYGTVPTLAERKPGDLSEADHAERPRPSPSMIPAALRGRPQCKRPALPEQHRLQPVHCGAGHKSVELHSATQPAGRVPELPRNHPPPRPTPPPSARASSTTSAAEATMPPLATSSVRSCARASPGLHQNLNVNFNLSHAASDQINIFPGLGGKSQSHDYSLALGYSISKNHLSNNLNLTWNRSKFANDELLHQHHRRSQPGRPQRSAYQSAALRYTRHHVQPVHQHQ